jgi:hypothetical protein
VPSPLRQRSFNKARGRERFGVGAKGRGRLERHGGGLVSLI